MSSRPPWMENIILVDGSSILMRVVGADSEIVAGYMCDVRGIDVTTTLKRVRRDQIKLRIQIRDEERNDLARNLNYDNNLRDYEALY